MGGKAKQIGEREGYTDGREGGLYRWERGRAIQMGEREGYTDEREGCAGE